MEYKEWTLVKGLDLKTDKNIGTHIELAPKICQQSTLLHNTTETSLCVHPKIHIKTNLGEAVLGDEYLTKVSLHQSSLSLFFPNWAPPPLCTQFLLEDFSSTKQDCFAKFSKTAWWHEPSPPLLLSTHTIFSCHHHSCLNHLHTQKQTQTPSLSSSYQIHVIFLFRVWYFSIFL